MNRDELIDFLTWVRDMGTTGYFPVEVITREFYDGELQTAMPDDSLVELIVHVYLAQQMLRKTEKGGE